MQRKLSSVVALAVAVLAPCAGAAQTAAGGRLSGAAELGWRGFTRDLSTQESGKFNEYQVTPAGLLLSQLHVGLLSADGANRLLASAYSPAVIR